MNETTWTGPTRAQVDAVATVFERLAAEQTDGIVAMAEGNIERQPGCGTGACHAGWYLYARHREEIGWVDDPHRPGLQLAAWTGIDDLKDLLDYHDGTHEMAEALGFESEDRLRAFARNHPSWWGNPLGARECSTSTGRAPSDARRRWSSPTSPDTGAASPSAPRPDENGAAMTAQRKEPIGGRADAPPAPRSPGLQSRAWKGPTQAQVAAVAGVFTALAERHRVVDTSRSRVVHHPECGTVACHGGWYAYHCAVASDTLAPPHGPDRQHVFDTGGDLLRYEDGAARIAADLGFGCALDLSNFADRHPEWWGNPCGELMFAQQEAFGAEPNEKLTLGDIARHWLGVAGRTPA